MEGYRRATSLVLCCLLYAAAAYAAQPQYTFTDLGPFRPNGIAGPWIVGSENGQPVRLNSETQQKAILTTHGLGGIAWAVIASGEAVGTITIQGVAGPVSSAAWWDIDGQVHLLDGPLPSEARGFADTGTVAGFSSGCPGGTHPMRWRNGGTDACLATPTPAGNRTTGRGFAVDRADRVWGINDEHELRTAMVWLADGTFFLGIPIPLEVLGSTANAVSSDGMGVGEMGHYCAQCSSRAWIGTLDGGGSLLPNPAGQPRPWTWCSANAINAQHQSVGVCSSPNPPFPHAVVLWPDVITATDVTLLTGLPLNTATGLNDEGEIIGTLNNGNGYLLTPVPVNVASAPCGGSVVCQCGDTVTSDYVFQANLRCDLHGTEAALIIGDHVSVSGNNFYLMGTGDGIGVLFDRTQSSQLGALHVTGFDTGVLMRGSQASVYHSSWVWDHRHDGVRLEAGAQDNWIWGVYSLLNGLRSGNIGSGIALDHADRNVVIYGIAWANPAALSLTSAHGNWSWQSAWYGGQHPMTMVNSHYNGLYQSVFIEGTITLQQSDDNSWFDGNDIRVPIVRQDAVASR